MPLTTLFDRAAKADAAGDHATAEALYDELWRTTDSHYFLVRRLEAMRLQGADDSEMQLLRDVTVQDIVESLSAQYSGHLVARKVAMGSAALDDLPPGLLGERELLDALGKRWERTGELPLRTETVANVAVLPKVGLRIEPVNEVFAAHPLLITPPTPLHTDMPLDRVPAPYSLPRLAGGWTELADVHAAVDSSSFVGRDRVWVDEYRAEFPQLADPRSDPLVFGVRDSDVLTFSRRELDTRTSAHGLNAFWLGGRFAAEFGHWITFHLSRIQYLREHPLWGSLPLVAPTGLPPSSLEYLRHLAPGIEFVATPIGTTLHFDRLIVAPLRVFAIPNPRRWDLSSPKHVYIEPEEAAVLARDLRSLAAASTLHDVPAAMFTARGAHIRRACHQRAEVEQLLTAQGISPVSLEKLSAADQVRVWLGADLLVGESAAWIEQSAVNADTRVVTIGSQFDQQWWADVSGLNSIRRHDITSILGRAVLPESDRWTESRIHGSWTLSPEGLDALAEVVRPYARR